MQQIIHAWSVGGILLWSLVLAGSTQAQIVPDATLPQSSSVTLQGNTNIITGGTVAGRNLFHSFGQFSLPTEGVAYFNNASEIQNIISRVTGSSISKIDGLIQANGTANLFLLNSNGVIFGPNASLDIGGSFLASTAASLNFADDTQFGVAAPQPSSLLTISVPIGLQFGPTAGSILNQSQAVNGSSSGLQVQPGRTLALIGGDVRLDSGTMRAPDGRIELGGIAGAGVAGLRVDGNTLSLNFPSDVARGDVSLDNNSLVDASGEFGGDIRVQGRRISLTNGSQIVIETLGSEPEGTLAVAASESVELAEESGLLTGAGDSDGTGSNVTITTEQLSVQNSVISTNALLIGEGDSAAITLSRGEPGDLFVNATELVELVGTSADSQIPSGLFTGASGSNSAGDLTIETGQLIVQDGAQVDASTSGNGFGGDLTVIATESVALTGTSADGQFLSGLSTQAEGNGNAGDLTVKTGQLIVQDGAQVGASALGNGSGGNLTVMATESVALTGTSGGGQLPSSLLTQAEGNGNAGDLKITTGQLIIQDKAEVAVSSKGSGNAGNVNIVAGSIQLGNQAALTAQSKSAKGGNITLQAQSLLLLRDNSLISTEAGGTGRDGNINISANVILAIPSENSDIIATSAGRGGGNIQIKTKGLIGPQFAEQPTSGSDIVATGKIRAKSVVTDVRTPEVLPAKVVDATRLVVQECQGGSRALSRGVSKFTNTGRGGLPPTPSEVLRSSSPLVDLGTFSQGEGNRVSATNPIDSEPASVVEAQGWIVGDKGEVVLTTQAQTGTPQSPWLTSAACTASSTSS